MTTDLQDRMDDLGEDEPGNVRAQVIGAMDTAWEHLYNKSVGHGVDEIPMAKEHVEGAIEVLAFLHKRLERLDKEDWAQALASLAEVERTMPDALAPADA